MLTSFHEIREHGPGAAADLDAFLRSLMVADASKREPSDADVDEVENTVIHASISAILWGGPRGDGLVYTVSRLAQSVETLGQTVTKLSDRVLGEEGLAQQVRSLSDKVEERYSANAKKIDRQFQLLCVLAVPLFTLLSWVAYRAAYVAITGHLK